MQPPLSNCKLMRGYLRKISNNQDSNSLANRLRRKRFKLFLGLVANLPRPVRIIDVGGTEVFWEQMKVAGLNEFEITLLNTKPQIVKYSGFNSLTGDARNLSQFNDNQFDVAFSNSVIEHVGSYADQQAMACEMQRVARRLYVQTPNYYFPLEPHFLFPFFQFLPFELKTQLVMRFRLGWLPRVKEKEKARDICTSIRLLTKKELKTLFAGARIHNEYFLGLVKSFVVIK